MKQAELNRQLAKQLGVSVCEIACRGFSLVTEVPDELAKPQVHHDDVDFNSGI